MVERIRSNVTFRRLHAVQYGTEDRTSISLLLLPRKLNLSSQCLGQQLAYIQATYVWARLLQRSSRLERAKDAQPIESLPPTKEWIAQGRTGRHAFESIWPHATVVLRVKVRSLLNIYEIGLKIVRGDYGCALNSFKFTRRHEPTTI